MDCLFCSIVKGEIPSKKVYEDENLYAFYDHTGLERHLEKMAANGWMLESVGTYALRYRRCEPKKLRFAVVYYPKTDSFCPDEPNHENLTFWDYCAGAGWQIVTQRDDTHIFYNEDLDAVPFETEAVVQVETMERAKKGYVLSNTITVACMLPTMLYLQVSQLRRDPVAFLADGYDLTMMLMIFGYYYAIINTIKTFLDNLRAFDLMGMKDGILLLAPFGIGVILGIFLIAKLITFLFEKYGVQTFCAILGLVISSPIAIFINTGLVSKLGSLSIWEILFGIVLMGAGAFVTVFVGEK